MSDIFGACVVMTCRTQDYKLGVLIGCRSAKSKFMPQCLQFPGGKYEPEEEGAAEAAARELYEEAHYDLDIYDLDRIAILRKLPFLNATYYDLSVFHYHHIGCPVDLIQNIIRNKEPDKNESWRIMAVEDLVRNQPSNMLPGMHTIFRML